MRLKINFNDVNFLLTRPKKAEAKTKEPKKPLLTITKSGSTLLNKAFVLAYAKRQPEKLFYQLAYKGNVFYLFISATKQEGFYVFTKALKSPVYQSKTKQAMAYLGNKKESVSYTLTSVKVENGNVRGFKLEKINKTEE